MVQVIALRALLDEEDTLRRAGVRDPTTHGNPCIRALAMMGNRGRSPQNIQRDLLLFLGEPSIPKARRVVINQRVREKRTANYSVCPTLTLIIMPHVLFHHLYTTRRDKFWKFLLGVENAAEAKVRLSTFWEGVARVRDPRLKDHPMIRKPNWQYRMLPIAIHGDEVAVVRQNRSGSESLDVLTWLCPLGDGNSLELKWYIASLFSSCKSSTTETELWAHVIWSLEALADGVFPLYNCGANPEDRIAWRQGSSDALLAGRELAEGFCGVTFC